MNWLSISRADVSVAHTAQHMIETFFFFHPAVCGEAISFCQQRELCCDDAALAYCADPMVYAMALLRLEEQRSSRLHLAMALDGHQAGSGLRGADRAYTRRGSAGGTVMAPLSLFGVCAMLGLFLFPLQQLFASLPDEAKRAAQVLGAAVVVPSPSTKVFISQLPVDRPPVRPLHVACLDELPATAHAASAKHASPQIAAATATPVATQSAPVTAANVSQKSDYIAQMRAAGYSADLDKYIAMKIQGVTPEFAQSMSTLGFGKPTADELISLKIFGVTPETVKELRASGLDATSFQDLVSYRIFKVTPEFVGGMKDAGFSGIPAKKLVELRVQGVTPEFARATKQQFPDVTVEQLVQLRIFHIDEAFMASAKSQWL